jgi:hypothetical protein
MRRRIPAHFMALSKEEDTYVSYEEEDTCTFHGTVQGMLFGVALGEHFGNRLSSVTNRLSSVTNRLSSVTDRKLDVDVAGD